MADQLPSKQPTRDRSPLPAPVQCRRGGMHTHLAQTQASESSLGVRVSPSVPPSFAGPFGCEFIPFRGGLLASHDGSEPSPRQSDSDPLSQLLRGRLIGRTRSLDLRQCRFDACPLIHHPDLAQPGRARGLGPRRRLFESGSPDHPSDFSGCRPIGRPHRSGR